MLNELSRKYNAQIRKEEAILHADETRIALVAEVFDYYWLALLETAPNREWNIQGISLPLPTRLGVKPTEDFKYHRDSGFSVNIGGQKIFISYSQTVAKLHEQNTGANDFISISAREFTAGSPVITDSIRFCFKSIVEQKRFSLQDEMKNLSKYRVIDDSKRAMISAPSQNAVIGKPAPIIHVIPLTR